MDVRLLAALPALTGDARRVAAALLTGRSVELDTQLAAAPACPPETLQRLAGHANDGVRAAVATNPHTPDEVRAALTRDRSERVRVHAEAAQLLAATNATDAAAALIADQIRAGDHALAAAASRHRDWLTRQPVSAAVLELDDQWETWTATLSEPDTITYAFAATSDLTVMATIAFRVLADSEYPHVAAFAAAHQDHLARAVAAAGGDVTLARNTDDPYARQLLAAWPDISDDALTALLADYDTDVIVQALHNPRTSPQTFYDTLSSRDDLLPRVTGHPYLLDHRVTADLLDRGSAAAMLIVLDPSTPTRHPVTAAMLTAAATHDDVRLRAAAASHAALPAVLQPALAADQNPVVRAYVLSRVDVTADAVLAASSHTVAWNLLHLLDDTRLLDLSAAALADTDEWSDAARRRQHQRLVDAFTSELARRAERNPAILHAVLVLSEQFTGSIAELLAVADTL